MARLRDAKTVFRRIGVRAFAARVWREVDDDNVFVWASSLSYSWILALFPFLIFLLSLIPYLPEERKVDALREIQGVVDTLPKAAADTINDFLKPRLQSLMEREQKGLLTIGIAVTLWAASGGMAATTAALDRAWDVRERRNFFSRRARAIVLTVIVSVMLMTIIFLLPVGTIVRNWFLETTGADRWRPVILALDVVRWTVAVAVMFLVLEVVYYFGPNIRQRWRWVTPGSLFCAVVWVALGLAFRFYVDRFGKYNETYGTLGGVAVLLLVFYFDALALLVGAEINSEIDYEVLGVEPGTRDLTKVLAKGAAPVSASAEVAG